MSYLDELLKNVEVEWKDLAEVASIGTGSHDTKDSKEDGQYMFYARGRVPLKLDSYDFDETAIITAGDGVGVGKVFHWVEGKYALHQRAYRIVPKSNVNARYIYHYVLSSFHAYVQKISVHSSVTSLRKPMFQKFQVPIPCPEHQEKSLEIQEEIVRILDAFTELNTDLTDKLATELTARKKQFIYYREGLFKFEKEVSVFPLGHENVGEFIRGSGLQKKDFTENGVGCIHYGQVYTHYDTYAYETKSFVSEEFAKKARKAKTGDVIIATTSENEEDLCKAVAWLGNEDIAVSSDACYYRHSLNPKYVAYFFQTEQFQLQKRPFITGTKVKRVNANNLAKILIPVPSPKDQDHIVSILDRFDTLTNSISEALPKEIELREKQYEYYRDMLLTFPKEKIEA